MLERWLKEARARVVEWAIGQLPKEAVRKDDAPDTSPARDLYEEIEDVLTDAAKVGAKGASGLLGIDFETPPEGALRYARERAAEMVGMKVGPDGSLVPNPNPKWRIDADLRASVNETVTTAIRDGWSPQQLTSALDSQFGPWRAETIARTETGFAYNEGTLGVYREEGVSLVEVVDGDGCLPEGHEDGAAEPEEDMVGQVQADRQANGQIWTVEQSAAHRLGHPNCTRNFLPFFAEVTPIQEAA